MGHLGKNIDMTTVNKKTFIGKKIKSMDKIQTGNWLSAVVRRPAPVVGLVTLAIGIGIILTGCKKYGYSFEDGFNNKGADTATITVDTSLNKPDYSMYAQATIFPGVVSDEEPRLTDYSVDIDLDYLKNPSQLRISVLPGAWMSTGLYAPTGEPITVIVPAGMNGLTAQIGCWTDNLTSKQASEPDAMKREPIIYTTKQLFPGVNYIRSPFGGPIYIKPAFASGQHIKLTFSGACVMPNFILGKTDPMAWKAAIAKSGVPWFELIAPHMIFTLQTEKAKRIGIQDPEYLMQTWEDIFNLDYSKWEGLSENAADPLDQASGLPWRVVADVQPSVGYGHNDYPVVIQDDDHWFKALSNAQAIHTSGSWGVLHEVGHNNQQSNWSFSNMGETTNNLFSYKVGDRLGFRPGQNYKVALDFAAKEDPEKDFFTDEGMAKDPISKCAFFLQIFDKYSFDFMTVLYTKTRHALRTSNNDQDRIDFVYDALCDFTHTNMLPFFDAWGLHVSEQQQDIVATHNYPYLNKKIWLYDPRTKTGGDESFTYVPKPKDRSEWTVLNYDSEVEKYPVEFTLDGDAGTFWNTVYSGTKPPYPHYATIDMAEKTKVLGFYFIGRKDNAYGQNPKTVDIYAGDDPDNLDIVISGAELDPTSNGQQNFFIPGGSKTFRYFKVIFTEAGNPAQPVMNVAEIGAF